jgi:hypothetical protein
MGFLFGQTSWPQTVDEDTSPISGGALFIRAFDLYLQGKSFILNAVPDAWTTLAFRERSPEPHVSRVWQ